MLYALNCMACLLQMHPSVFCTLCLVCILDLLSVMCNQALSHACVALHQRHICSEPSASLRWHTQLLSGLVNCFPDRTNTTRPASGGKPPVCCAVLSLGRIEYLHPAFHDVKNFWPVGYCVDRLAATPASGKKETLHRCQILEAPDGSGPLFR
jgi:hypothetical protein